MNDTSTDLTLPRIGTGSHHQARHIWLPQLVLEAAQSGQSVIEDRAFTDCLMEGPAVLLPISGCNFDSCNLGDSMGDPRNLMLAPMGPQKVTGAVAFRNTTFTRCTFVAVGFTGTPAFLEEMIQMLSGARSANGPN